MSRYTDFVATLVALNTAENVPFNATVLLDANSPARKYLESLVNEMSSGGALAEHLLVGSKHTAAGLTAGHFLKATGATTFGFGAHGLSTADVPDSTDKRYVTDAQLAFINSLMGGRF